MNIKSAIAELDKIVNDHPVLKQNEQRIRVKFGDLRRILEAMDRPVDNGMNENTTDWNAGAKVATEFLNKQTLAEKFWKCFEENICIVGDKLINQFCKIATAHYAPIIEQEIKTAHDDGFCKGLAEGKADTLALSPREYNKAYSAGYKQGLKDQK